MGLVVLRIEVHVFWIFVSLWSDQPYFMVLFMVLNLWIGAGL
jgi:hypothetical protein